MKELNESKLEKVAGGYGEKYGWHCPFCGRLITSEYVNYMSMYGGSTEWPYGTCECGCQITVQFNIGLVAHKSYMYKKCDYHAIDGE